MSRAWLLILICTVAGGQTLPDDIMTNSMVNSVYEEASEASEIVGQLPPRTATTARDVSKSGDELWVKIRYETVSGWLPVTVLDRSSRMAIRDFRNAVLQKRRPGAAVRAVDAAGDGQAGRSLVLQPTGSGVPIWLESLMTIGVLPLAGVVVALGMFLIFKRKKA